ncbi:endospore germination permease [Paenibacillus sp. SYP-B3998]|uniref:Endospore germination permease n=1 Tax=Paenibacillus sp. SYP-B3998 TaxID=2678564 RepID=A0A6G3ZTX0_9BACL|nr:endospore germination permease [Paenibacillus sp. SYP-B3998]NEW05154.1 endospore germination permease [Paenibacillus sp. SYP-B3998]
MKFFEYGEKEVNFMDMAVTIASMIIGVGVLILPRSLAQTTHSSDGWISMTVAGLLAIGIAWYLAKIAIHFSKQGFFAYAAAAVTKPVAYVVTTALAIYFLTFCAFEARAIANIAKQYLFERTPVEAIALTFLMVVVYAVSGSRVGLIRLNILFLPFIFGITLTVLIFSTSIFSFEDLKPFFITNWRDLAIGVKDSTFSFLGFEIILFYISLMSKPKDAPKAAIIGVAIPVFLYIAIYIICVGVFSQFALKEITFPAVELAKEMQIPGEFFERFESIFFTIWIMTVFTTTIMAFDCSICALRSMFTQVKRKTWVLILSPAIYMTCMLPRNMSDFSKLGTFISYFGMVIAIIAPGLVYLIAKLRKVKSDAT